MNAPFDPQKVMPTQAASKPEKSAIDWAEEASVTVSTLAPILLYTITSYEQYQLTDSKAQDMLTVSVNNAYVALKQLEQAYGLDLDTSVDYHQHLHGIIVAMQEISRFYMTKEFTISALYGVHFAAEYLNDELQNFIRSLYNTSPSIQ